jgi:hypothetical protein
LLNPLLRRIVAAASSDAASASPLSPFASATLAVAAPPSEKVIERYKQMLVANPAEGTALDPALAGLR